MTITIAIATDPMNEAEVASDAIPHQDPFALFDTWFADARATEPNDSNAMALATATPDGRPSVRMVLLKGHGANLGSTGGFVFYTNSLSRKGQDLAANPHGALCLYWKSLSRQVRIEGSFGPVTPAEADAYFASRARESQLGAWASLQSRTLPARGTLIERYRAEEARYDGSAVPRPPHWTGYRLRPDAIEFWHDIPNRLHDRLLFERDDGGAWISRRLYP